MNPGPSIQCSQCLKPASDSDVRCPHCDGALIRICGECRFKNSIAKRYCDNCGTRLRPDTATAPRHKISRPETGSPHRGAFHPHLPGTPMGPGFDPFRGPAPRPPQKGKTPRTDSHPHARRMPAVLKGSVILLALAAVAAAIYGAFSLWTGTAP